MKKSFKSKCATLFKRGPKFSKRDLERLWPDRELLSQSYSPVNNYAVLNEPDGDTSSVCSYSTNATTDDIPGPGRLIDKYIYQRLGRKLEKAALWVSMRFNVSPPSAAQILQYFQLQLTMARIQYDGSHLILRQNFSQQAMDGLKSLVKQTQSNSIYRSTAAFASLIHLSTSQSNRKKERYEFYDFFLTAARAEPIFHFEELANMLDDSHPQKAGFLSLARLGHAHVALSCKSSYLANSSLVALSGTHSFMWRLVEILDESRLVISETDIIVLIGKACVLYAETVAYIVNWDEPTPKSIDRATRIAFELAYFISIYLINSIIVMQQRSSSWLPGTAQFNGLLLSTFTCWFNSVAASFASSVSRSSLHTTNFETVRLVKLVLSPFRAVQNTSYEPLLPDLSWSLEYDLVDKHVFPRQVRETIRGMDKEPQILQSDIDALIRRARRLLCSSSELEREARQSAVQLVASPRAVVSEAISRGRSWRAREYPWLDEAHDELMLQVVSSNYGVDKSEVYEDLYSGFYPDYSQGIMEGGEDCDDDPEPVSDIYARYATYKAGTSLFQGDPKWWAWYNETRQFRHAWGIAFRSNYDWDWDPAETFEWLYSTESTDFEIKSDHGESVDILMKGNRSGLGLPKLVRIAYTTRRGKTKCRTFYASASSESESEEEDEDEIEVEDSASELVSDRSDNVFRRGIGIEEEEDEDEEDANYEFDGGDDDDDDDDEEEIEREYQRYQMTSWVISKWAEDL